MRNFSLRIFSHCIFSRAYPPTGRRICVIEANVDSSYIVVMFNELHRVAKCTDSVCARSDVSSKRDRFGATQ